MDDFDQFPTLGYLAADWMEAYLLQPDCIEPTPFVPTLEQLEFLIELYRLHPVTGKRVIHRAVLSRPRGWGKSPFFAGLTAFEALGPALCDGWDADGQPVGVPWEIRRIPECIIAATTEDQTAFTWEPLLQMLRGSPAEAEYGFDAMDSFVALANGGHIRQITSSATAAKGGRKTFAVLDQTETWVPSNRGPKLAQVMRNNATKVGGLTIESPNAYTIGENSVAEKTAKFHQEIEAGRIKGPAAKSLLYDHRPAPLETNIYDRRSLIAGLRVAYGDSSGHPGGCVLHEPPCRPGWVDIDRIAADFWDTANDPAVMSADFLNQIDAAVDAYVTMPEMRAIEHTEIEVSGTEPITLGFDGSEGRKRGIADSTVLIGFSISQKHFFKLGIWSQPDGPRGEGWRPPRLEIEQTVKEAFDSYNVVGFYADPSAGWAGDVKTWEARYHRRLKAKISVQEPIKWPQRNVANTVESFSQLLSAIRREEVSYDGSPEITAHFLNARRDPRRTGFVLKKPDDDQDYSKIDAAWGAMMAYKAGLDAIGRGVTTKPRRLAPRRIY